ncbi:MAG: hypothetical protein LZF86_190048 [Nitrospira sp.]|nr:MAG: hypothetical protein LZF86_190048 [Nitrospira sp.]
MSEEWVLTYSSAALKNLVDSSGATGLI